MYDAVRQAGLSEILLFLVLVIGVPLLGVMLSQLKRYERLHGPLAKGEKDAAAPPPTAAAQPEKPAKKAPAPDAAGEVGEEGPAPDVFPYRQRPFLGGGEKSCLAALGEALGPDVVVFPKVALWEVVEPEEKGRGYAGLLSDKALDFLVCDRKTMAPLTSVMFNPGKGQPAGPIDELVQICDAAGVNVVFLDLADEYDADGLRAALDLPSLEI